MPNTDEVYFWIGNPTDPDAGVSECGIRTMDKIKSLVENIEAVYGQLRDMYCTVPDLPGVIGFTTERGYRVAIIERTKVDVTCSQEAIGEWVEGV